MQGTYAAVNFTVVNLARSGIDVMPAATCWYQLAPQVSMVCSSTTQVVKFVQVQVVEAAVRQQQHDAAAWRGVLLVS